MGRKRTACLACASIKAVCIKGQPCLRCSRLSITCTYADGRRTSSSLTAEQPARQYVRSRSRLGCLNCHRRKKKCDEQRPTCGDCKRLHLDCHPRVPIEKPSGAVTVANHHSSAEPREQHAPSGNAAFTSWANRVADGLDGDLSLPFTDWVALIEYENLGGLSRPATLANSVALVDLPVPSPKDDELGYATFLPATALNNLTGVTLDALRSWTIGERHLLNHFLQSVSRALVLVEDEDNPFLRVIVPMALENSMVRHALVALSACHLSRVYPTFEHALLVHRSHALLALKTELVDDGIVEWALATTLLLCLTEVCVRK
jgi:transcriptional activator protein UGA3